MSYSCLKGRTYKLSLVYWIPLQVCNLRYFTSQRASPIQIKRQKSYGAYRGRTTFQLLPSSEMLHASQVNSIKAAVRLPTAVQPAFVQADPKHEKSTKAMTCFYTNLTFELTFSGKKLSQAPSFTHFFIIAFTLLVNL